MGLLSSIFGKKVDYKQLINEGAIVLDVRTKGEYQQGHIKNSINIPLDQLKSNLNKLDKNKVIITCCASGMRSGAAKSMLKSSGFEAHNGGSWQRLR